jgi:AcrR family transcriptional regulator
MEEEPTTSQRIARAARELLERSGPEAVSIRKLATAVGLSAMAIYRHYPSREAVLARVVDDAFEELAAAWSAPAAAAPRARLLASFAGYLEYALAHPHLFDYAFASRRPGARRFPRDFRARRSPTLNLVADALAAGMRQGEFRHADVWAVAMSLWAQSHGLIALYRAGRFGGSRREFETFHRAALRRFLDGLAA